MAGWQAFQLLAWKMKITDEYVYMYVHLVTFWFVFIS